MLTYHNDNARTGANLHETISDTVDVNAAEFGKLFTIRLDGDVYAQPLYVPKVAVPSQGIHNIVYAATENNTVYAIDADDRKGVILWNVHLGPALYLRMCLGSLHRNRSCGRNHRNACDRRLNQNNVCGCPNIRAL